ncbi:MAG: VPLPA-CTERM sorting domain-containing protein [Gammaproteobacteria bacterium]|nr:VPLPA-CTERM sorting domain-containing protein [Gammaproteobacteria bacterium]
MRKFLVTAIAVFLLSQFTSTANAMSVDVNVASIGIEDYAMEGTLAGSGDFGAISSIDCAFFCNFNFDATEYFNDTSGNTLHFVEGSDDYEFTLSAGEFAWGALWNWNSNIAPVLIIFDCGTGNLGDSCAGATMPMLSPPFPSESWTFTGTVSAVPIPTAVWLFGSGLVGLIGVARRKKA